MENVELLSQSLKYRQWLATIQWHACVDSTNTLARKFASEHPNLLPALFVADQQTQGRGRSNHQWWSPHGCMMLTLAVPSSLLPPRRDEWSQLALIVGVALAEAVESCFPILRAQLKWPNDLYLSGKKAGGILIESFALNRESTVFLIGMGVNINIDWENAPPELLQRATCLSSELNSSLVPLDLLPSVIDTLARRLQGWSQGNETWHDFWTTRCFLAGRTIAVTSPSSNASTRVSSVGRCEGVSEEGQLLIRTEQGMTIRSSVGEVQILS